MIWGFPGGSDGKESACNAGDLDLIPAFRRPPGEGMATHSSILAWRMPWTEEPGRLQAIGLQRVRYDWVTCTSLHFTVILIQKDKCTQMCVAALFTTARTWKQPRCPSTEKWIKKLRYVYTMEYYSAIKRNEMVPFADTWMETVIQGEESQKEKNKYCIILLICGI